MYEHNESLLRWDSYFYDICKTVAKNAQCLSRKIGAILVRDKTIICTGYNGPPRGVRRCDDRWEVDEELRIKAGLQTAGTTLTKKDINEIYEKVKGKCPRYVPELGFKSGEGLEWCVAGHAERNALINAARMGIRTKGCKLYMDCGIPCTPCLVEIINAGVEEIIVTSMVFYDQSSHYLLQEAPDLGVRIYSNLCEHNNLLIKNDLKYSNVHGYCPDCGMQIGEV